MRDSLTRAQKQEVSDIMGAQYVRSGEHMLLEYTLCINYNVQSLNILKKWTLISGCVCAFIFDADPWLSVKYADDLSSGWAGSQLKGAGRSMGKNEKKKV